MIMDVNTYGMILIAFLVVSIGFGFIFVRVINRIVNLPTKVDIVIGVIASAVTMFYLYGFMF